jgi:ankyrin repeat protein
MVIFLLARQAQADATDDQGQTPLHYAARLGSSTKVLGLLLDATESRATSGARNGRNRDTRKPKDSAESLLNSTDKWGRSALFWATLNGHRNSVAYLVDAKASATVQDSFGETPLMAAERRARCGAQERSNGLRPSVFGDIASLLGGSGKSKQVAKYI